MNDFEGDNELPGDEPWRDHRAELLEKVTRRGRALKFRRQATLVTVMTGVLLVPFAAVAATNTQTNVPVLRWASSGSDEPAPTTTSTFLSTTTTIDEATSTTVAASTTSSSTVFPATSTSTIPLVRCRNGYDPDCGPLRWDPKPPAVNPLGVDVAVTKIDGRTVALAVNTTGAGLISVDFGDGSDFGSGGDAGIAACKGELFGTWAWPETAPQREMFNHEYATPGSYTVTVTVAPYLTCGESPYTEGLASATVVVGTPATTTTTPGP